jgi:serine/threonine protein kinase
VIAENNLSKHPKRLVLEEILAIKQLQHPNIRMFLDAYLVETGYAAKREELWFVLEYVEGCVLRDVIENNDLKEEQISRICFEVRHIIYLLDPVFNLLSQDLPRVAVPTRATNYPPGYQVRQCTGWHIGRD